MAYYLLEHKPTRLKGQFYTSRNNTPTWAVGVHTVEVILDRIAPDMGAENTAGYISRRPDAGSYSEIVDLDSVVSMVPDEYTTFSVAEPGYNSRTWNIAMACRVSDLDENDPLTRLLIATVGKRIAAMWQRQGVDIARAAYWGGTNALVRACLFNHGDVQPGDRTDAWAKHPQRATFDAWLVHDILWHAGLADGPEPEESEEDDDMAGEWILMWHEGENRQYVVLAQGGVNVGKHHLALPSQVEVFNGGFNGHVDNRGSQGQLLDSLPWIGAAPAWVDQSEEQILAELQQLPKETIDYLLTRLAGQG